MSLGNVPRLAPIRRSSGTPAPVDRLESRPAETIAPRFAEVLAAAGRPYYDEAGETARSAEYYRGVQPTFQDLSELVTETHTQKLDYKPRQFLYPWTDLQPTLRLKSVYSTEQVPTDARGRGNKPHLATGLVTTLLAAPADTVGLAGQLALLESRGGLNCEHVVPKIWFDDEGIPTGDLHILFASNDLTNLERTNRRLGELGTHDYPAHSGEGWTFPKGDMFEPAGGKGEMARATLYFLLRYPGKVGDAPGEYTREDLGTLLKWHRENPVTLHERHRNQEIAKLQGNRNPFIDHPEWAEKVDFSLGLAA